MGKDVNIKIEKPWPVWLSGLNTVLQTERLQVWFPVRAHSWVVGQVPGVRGGERGNWSMFLSHIDVSLPLSLPPLPLKINK